MAYELPKWRQDILASQGIKSTYLLTGNVNDLQLQYDETSGCYCEPLTSCLHSYLVETGYSQVVFYNRVRGFHNAVDPTYLDSFRSWMIDQHADGIDSVDDCGSCDFDTASRVIASAMAGTGSACAVVFDLVTASVAAPDRIFDEERAVFARLFAASRSVALHTDRNTGKRLTNILFLVADKPNDVPSWFYVNNPYVKVLTVSAPGRDERLALVRSYPGSIVSDFQDLSTDERRELALEIANITEGFSCVELDGFLESCRRRGGVRSSDIRREVDRFKYGVFRDCWTHLNAKRIARAEARLHDRIKGQDQAIERAMDVLWRAASGLSIAGQSGASARPKGVLFLAGPTGTGKTELAKSLTEAIFSDENMMIRFDMSEFGERHSDQRLFGAPPGYVGYEEGGELTNAVRERPHCLLLFDEIEKAHQSILDKFLQILDDGRLTDSHGETVYFGETVIVFTSNLGMSMTDPMTGMQVDSIRSDTYSNPDEFHAEVMRRIRMTLRPELMNRIGDGFVVFDFISDEVAIEILQAKLRAFGTNLLRTRDISVFMTTRLYAALKQQVMSDLSMGGRGIVNRLQSDFVDPLGRAFVTMGTKAGDMVVADLGENEENSSNLMVTAITHGPGSALPLFK